MEVSLFSTNLYMFSEFSFWNDFVKTTFWCSRKRENTEDEQKVNELQNQPLELDVMLRNEQLKEIEVWKQEKHWQHDCIIYLAIQYILITKNCLHRNEKSYLTLPDDQFGNRIIMY